jgi:hypothetical protein
VASELALETEEPAQQELARFVQNQSSAARVQTLANAAMTEASNANMRNDHEPERALVALYQGGLGFV